MGIRLENIERLHAALLAGVCVLSALSGAMSPWSVLLGGAVMGGNFWLMRQLFRRVLGAGQQVSGGAVVALAVGKFILFLFLLGLVFWRVRIDAVAFAIGATVLLVACMIEALRPKQVRVEA